MPGAADRVSKASDLDQAFVTDDLVEVSDDNKNRRLRVFVATMPNWGRPYLVVSEAKKGKKAKLSNYEKFEKQMNFRVANFKYIRAYSGSATAKPSQAELDGAMEVLRKAGKVDCRGNIVR